MNKRIDKKKKYNVIGLILIILILLINAFGIAYSKYIQKVNGSITAKAAKAICNMEVTSSGTNATIINPYCIVTVKNYNIKEDSSKEFSETDVNFKISVMPREDEFGNEFELPSYYWVNTDTNEIIGSGDLTGSVQKGIEDVQEYKIVFINSGEEEIEKYVDFKLTAVQ